MIKGLDIHLHEFFQIFPFKSIHMHSYSFKPIQIHSNPSFHILSNWPKFFHILLMCYMTWSKFQAVQLWLHYYLKGWQFDRSPKKAKWLWIEWMNKWMDSSKKNRGWKHCLFCTGFINLFSGSANLPTERDALGTASHSLEWILTLGNPTLAAETPTDCLERCQVYQYRVREDAEPREEVRKLQIHSNLLKSSQIQSNLLKSTQIHSNLLKSPQIQFFCLNQLKSISSA